MKETAGKETFVQEREQFTFYASFARALKRIRKNTDRCAAYDAIVDFALYGTEPSLERMSDAAAIAFELIRPVLDRAARQSNGPVKANAEKNAAGKGSEGAKKPGKPTQSSGAVGGQLPGSSGAVGGQLPGSPGAVGGQLPGSSGAVEAQLPGSSGAVGAQLPGSSGAVGAQLPGSSGAVGGQLAGSSGAVGGQLPGSSGAVEAQLPGSSGAVGGKEKEKEVEIEAETEAEREEEKEKESSSLKQRGAGGERRTAPPAPAPAPAPVRERDVWNMFLRRINAHPSDGAREELRGYIERLGPEAVLLGLEVALDEQKTGWSYIRGILRRYEREGLTSAEAVRRAERERERQRDGPAAGTEQPDYGPIDLDQLRHVLDVI